MRSLRMYNDGVLCKEEAGNILLLPLRKAREVNRIERLSHQKKFRQELIDEGEYPNIKELAKATAIDPGVAAKAIRLTLLSPIFDLSEKVYRSYFLRGNSVI